MSGKVLLPPLNNPCTRHVCSYLDAASLARVAGVSKGFHLMAPSVDSSAGRIQKLIQKYQGRDGGLDLASNLRSEELGIQDSSHNAWVFGGLTCDFEYVTLYAQGKNFSPAPVSLQDHKFVGRSERYLFVRNPYAHMEVRDLQGELVATIPELAFEVGCFELGSDPNLLRLVKVDQNARLSVWEVRDKQVPQKMLEHNLPQDKPFQIEACMRFGDLLVLVTSRVGHFLNVWSYDLKDQLIPPKKIHHPNHTSFSVTRQKFFCSNSHQLFFLGNDSRSIVAYIVENGALKLHWEKSGILPSPLSICLACANERYLLVETSRLCAYSMTTIGQQDDVELEVFDTQTGESKGSFTCSFVGSQSDKNPHYTFQIWHDDILAVQDDKGWHFWELPHGRRLHSIELENSSPIQTVASKTELALLFQEKSNNHFRLLDLSNMTQLKPSLPNLILHPPAQIPTQASLLRKELAEHKAEKEQPPPPPLPPEPSFFEEICTHFWSAISWLVETWTWVWKKLFS